MFLLVLECIVPKFVVCSLIFMKLLLFVLYHIIHFNSLSLDIKCTRLYIICNKILNALSLCAYTLQNYMYVLFSYANASFGSMYVLFDWVYVLLDSVDVLIYLAKMLNLLLNVLFEFAKALFFSIYYFVVFFSVWVGFSKFVFVPKVVSTSLCFLELAYTFRIGFI